MLRPDLALRAGAREHTTTLIRQVRIEQPTSQQSIDSLECCGHERDIDVVRVTPAAESVSAIAPVAGIAALLQPDQIAELWFGCEAFRSTHDPDEVAHESGAHPLSRPARACEKCRCTTVKSGFV